MRGRYRGAKEAGEDGKGSHLASSRTQTRGSGSPPRGQRWAPHRRNPPESPAWMTSWRVCSDATCSPPPPSPESSVRPCLQPAAW
eukprot:1183536-Prorocentrum_minimum.AAC.2